MLSSLCLQESAIERIRIGEVYISNAEIESGENLGSDLMKTWREVIFFLFQ